jgi:hypothetical protein
MFALGPLGFAAPWLLVGLAALPILWLLLRAVPPAPIRRRFPGVALLLGLRDDDAEADKTPWWLLLLRTLAVAALIVGFAGPVLNPEARVTGTGPVLIVADATWADARDWDRRRDRIAEALDDAGRAGRSAAIVMLTDPPVGAPVFQAADALKPGLPALTPRAWEPDPAAVATLAAALPDTGFDTIWISDGVARDSRAPLLAALAAQGAVTVFQNGREVTALRPAVFADGQVTATVVRSAAATATEAEVSAQGLDPAGTERELARAPVTLPAGETEGVATFDLPSELRNRITRFEIVGQRSAGAVSLTDDALKRRKVALIDGGADREGLELLSPTHYLRQALAPTADLLSGTLTDILPAQPDVIILADVARIAEVDPLTEWVEGGGLLVRFAGPRLAASDIGRGSEDALLPVRLRAGGRSVGGAMSWGEPKTLAPFVEESPFRGLAVPAEVAVSAQVMAEPDPDLAERTIAALSDGTPLVTSKALGDGRVVLFHVTANAEWSGLPLSGLFVQMLERLAVSTRPDTLAPEDLAGTTWVADRVLDGFGALSQADDLPGIPGERLVAGTPGPDLPPGLYGDGERQVALNVIARDRTLAAAVWPAGVTVEGGATLRQTDLKGWLLATAVAMLLADILAALWLSGRLSRSRAGVAVQAIALVLAFAGTPDAARAQEADAPPSVPTSPLPAGEAALIAAAGNVALAYVETADRQVDRISAAGLLGLSEVLFARTSVEPILPVGIDLERDELSVLTFLYWPVTPEQAAPSPAAYARLNRFLRSGGMILFDTRDADIAGFGAATPAGRRLQALAAPLDVPPLEPLPPDHVLTRSFYLLQDFPGRHAGQAIWVEAAPPDAEQAEGMPFRNLNDGVTPIVIGGNDWAAAWAIDENGAPMFPIGRGLAGERQREVAYRFGVNLIMHVLTGNYKSDQVHVPALLERLGQ